ncbi:putative transcriptional regulator, ModE family [Desulfarculus baarsii DSM 2075]|uniref:Transcriptional regulator, ModE family n=1 Tax=Desulfarculus baarsii (strain ATCC 33931 / DSM 2075 / LMG 7858 / VKM B-1802 / 2st14) TaxID=644282 RepID=E1QJS1_DESB2|nr:LysR family transcriptional regulator [Desulfarculus baarsii]ADK85814.1 putative transcriptional regulator, ModE family [Desulfarculus baarsii DSM 2075]
MPKPTIPHERNALACGPEIGHDKLNLKGRIWLEKDGKTFLSWGRVVLLERIDQAGSLSAAARSMGMSYSHAWNLVEEMNCLAVSPLVEKQAGGVSGGGARLTEAGRQAIARFWRLVEEFRRWVDERQAD